ncbi:hypothetical protein QQF64_006038 [Cirrhinus molitorella]|uniref:Peptidase A2 domain-containing protein n=1 Tax=Cirrhinus molitorella TaxID=172907 RepID=A0ABR3MDW2_9TELE
MIVSSYNWKQFNNSTGPDGAKVKATPHADLHNLPVHVHVTVADLSSTQLIFLDALLRMWCAGTVTRRDILERHVVEKKWICASTGLQQDIQLMVDTGSAVSILPMSKYTGFFSQAPLSPPKLSLVSFGDNAIEVKGCLPASISYGGYCTTTDLYIVQKGSAVLGRDLFTGLCLQLCDGQVSTDQCVHPVSSIDAKLENKLGCVRGFVHRVHVRSGVQPVQQKLRRLPFSIRGEVSKELQKLIQQDVIEPVDASEWVSPIVVTRKKDGGI